ncbi:copper amine oxidase N-terminal domain-containing protein [Paenibacillus protaetiae]|uniref:Copper amine oxidase N-terminal domain-containing protein n=1 Tax=Paenibacillus protaetiae TaxID=2509456 RepID=A0A4P6EWM9_9BACL|nr:copper amine oxidase N-terminal domain-containing protein [Paenibacillus protaetiae]QAY67790.1 copper amine oxidase N-terminal domain-containing protein [Paenibacillus protaetiae]
MKKLIPFLALLAAVCLLVPLASAAPAAGTVQVQSQPVTLVFDGQKLQLPEGQYAFLYENRTYVPIRFISYALQKSVKWDNAAKTVRVTEPAPEEKAALADSLAKAAAAALSSPAAPASRPLTITPVTAKLSFDGTEKALPAGQSIYNYNNSIYVPIRFLSEASGTNVNWDGKTGTITGESASYRAAQGEQGSGGGNEGNGDSAGDGSGLVVQPGKESLEDIQAKAESKLTALQNTYEPQFQAMIANYKKAATDQARNSIIAQGEAKLDECDKKFRKILDDTAKELRANGYDAYVDGIISGYQAQYDAMLDEGFAELMG